MGEAGSSNGKDSEMEPTRVIYLITTEHYGGHSLCVSFTFNHISQEKRIEKIFGDKKKQKKSIIKNNCKFKIW